MQGRIQDFFVGGGGLKPFEIPRRGTPIPKTPPPRYIRP